MLDPKLASNIMNDVMGMKVHKVTEIVGKGFVNRTFLVQMTDRKSVTRTLSGELRDQNDGKKHSLLSEAKNQHPISYILRMREEEAVPEYRKEKWCMEQASDLAIPVPQVLKIGNCGPVSYMIETCIHGENGLDNDNPELLWYHIGKYARKLHSIPVTGFGLALTDEENGIFSDSFSPTLEEQVDYNLTQLTAGDPLCFLGAYEKGKLNSIIEILEYVKRRNYRIGLNHGDLSRKNTIIGPDGSVTLIDFGCALAHAVPYYDFANIFGEVINGGEPDTNMLHSLAEGYGISYGGLMDMKKDIYAIMLLNAFDKARWALDQRRDEIQAYVLFADRVLAKALKLFE